MGFQSCGRLVAVLAATLLGQIWGYTPARAPQGADNRARETARSGTNAVPSIALPLFKRSSTNGDHDLLQGKLVEMLAHLEKAAKAQRALAKARKLAEAYTVLLKRDVEAVKGSMPGSIRLRDVAPSIFKAVLSPTNYDDVDVDKRDVEAVENEVNALEAERGAQPMSFRERVERDERQDRRKSTSSRRAARPAAAQEPPVTATKQFEMLDAKDFVKSITKSASEVFSRLAPTSRGSSGRFRRLTEATSRLMPTIKPAAAPSTKAKAAAPAAQRVSRFRMEEPRRRAGAGPLDPSRITASGASSPATTTSRAPLASAGTPAAAVARPSPTVSRFRHDDDRSSRRAAAPSSARRVSTPPTTSSPPTARPSAYTSAAVPSSATRRVSRFREEELRTRVSSSAATRVAATTARVSAPAPAAPRPTTISSPRVSRFRTEEPQRRTASARVPAAVTATSATPVPARAFAGSRWRQDEPRSRTVAPAASASAAAARPASANTVAARAAGPTSRWRENDSRRRPATAATPVRAVSPSASTTRQSQPSPSGRVSRFRQDEPRRRAPAATTPAPIAATAARPAPPMPAVSSTRFRQDEPRRRASAPTTPAPIATAAARPVPSASAVPSTRFRQEEPRRRSPAPPAPVRIAAAAARPVPSTPAVPSTRSAPIASRLKAEEPRRPVAPASATPIPGPAPTPSVPATKAATTERDAPSLFARFREDDRKTRAAAAEVANVSGKIPVMAGAVKPPVRPASRFREIEDKTKMLQSSPFGSPSFASSSLSHQASPSLLPVSMPAEQGSRLAAIDINSKANGISSRSARVSDAQVSKMSSATTTEGEESNEDMITAATSSSTVRTVTTTRPDGFSSTTTIHTEWWGKPENQLPLLPQFILGLLKTNK